MHALCPLSIDAVVDSKESQASNTPSSTALQEAQALKRSRSRGSLPDPVAKEVGGGEGKGESFSPSGPSGLTSQKAENPPQFPARLDFDLLWHSLLGKGES